MFNLFSKRPPGKRDVVLAVVTAAMGVWKAFDTYNEFKAEQANTEIKENEK